MATSRDPDPSRARALLAGASLVFAASLPLSIAVAQAALALCIVAWLAGGRRPAARSRLLAPAAAYAALTLLSALASDTPLRSLLDSKELFQLAILIVVPAAAAVHGRPRLLGWFLLGASTSAVWGITHHLATAGGLANRARGPFGHYMTFAGVLLLAAVAAWALLMAPPGSRDAPSRRTRLALVLVLLLLTVGLTETYARNAWIGFVVAIPWTLLLTRPRLLPVLALTAALLLLLAPPGIRDRALSSVSLDANRDRIEIWEVGLDMIAEHPVLGLGPTRVQARYGDYTPGPVHPHLHNNFVQIAAERGLPALAAWLWCLVRLARGLGRRVRRDAFSALGLGTLIALLVGGLFEYNFGDSEVKMTFLFLASLALDGRPDPPPQSDPA